ncbi:MULTISPECIES: flagellar biosynthetic protein FliO [Bacillaceae]|uniref:flagellar biosynthetic protein FliO n=1 Tax=Bacillaceae TaxID=186817 RepID=UPI001BDEF1DC|nr:MULTISPECIES: flagellar biosynthetic protein FliO [Bacillaceae]MDX8362241.1 flagellar biosynthetic protein FliO [Cytobacillus sp. IB215316]
MQAKKILLIAILYTIIFAPLQSLIVYAEQSSPMSVTDYFDEDSNLEDGNNEDEVGPLVENQNTVGLWDVTKMIFATIFVILLIYLLIKFVNKKSSAQSNFKYVENLGGTGLGSNRSVQLIKVGKRILVVGVGEDIQLLREIDNEHEVQQIVDDHHNKLNQMVQPAHLVKKLLSSRDKKQHHNDENFASVLKSQLDELSEERKHLLHEQDKERD